MPVSWPVASMVANDVGLTLHVPPATACVYVATAPAHTVDGPFIVSGTTVTCIVTKQPDVAVYVIFAFPTPTPVTRPVLLPTVATALLLLSQVPPNGEDESKLVPPEGANIGVPVIAVGCTKTVNGAVL